MEFSGTDFADPLFNATTCASASGGSTSPGCSGAFSSPDTNWLFVSYFKFPATVTFSTGPAFQDGGTNLPLVESAGGGATEDLISGYYVSPFGTAENYSGTITAATPWTSVNILIAAGGPLNQSAPTASSGGGDCQLNLNQTCGWRSDFSLPAQTIPAGTYTLTYWTSNPVGSAGVTATILVGYSTSAAPCASVTTIASWSASLVKGANGATTSTTTASPTVLPANAYLCLEVSPTAVSSKRLDLLYDNTFDQTNLSTPTLTVPDRALLLLSLALVAPLAGRRRRRDLVSSALHRLRTFGLGSSST
jgi:hypothetical protein